MEPLCIEETDRAETPCQCDNCGKTFRADELDEADGPLTPGGEVPAGRCPDCGAFCYIAKE